MSRFKGEGAGKGDKTRPYDQKEYDKNYILAFGKECDPCKGTGLENGKASMDFKANKICPKCSGLGKVDKYDRE